MKLFSFRSFKRSFEHPERAGVRIEVGDTQVYVDGRQLSEGRPGELPVHVDLTEDEALELLAWLRRWEGES